MSRHPEIVWAQRSDKIFLTVEQPDAKGVKLNIDPDGKFSYSARGGPDDQCFEVEFPLFDKINVEESKISTGLRHTFCVLTKEKKEWWKRLLKTEGKPPPYIKVDWSRWVDEDEEESAPGPGFDMSSMNDFSNFDMGDFGGNGVGNGDDDDDDDDDELPDAEKAA